MRRFLVYHKRTIQTVAVIIAAILCLSAFLVWQKLYHSYPAEAFGIEEIKSESDADGDGIDDYTDMMLGARSYIQTRPLYKSRYYEGGYPTDRYGVCTDVIWQAFAAAGYDLKGMVDADIAADPYVYNITETDPNIDFRRVRNLDVFFNRYAEKLTADTLQLQQWQAGDIVVFEGHIAICSDKRNASGLPFIIHHGNIFEGAVEVNEMWQYRVVGHYRWNLKD